MRVLAYLRRIHVVDMGCIFFILSELDVWVSLPIYFEKSLNNPDPNEKQVTIYSNGRLI